MIWTNLREKEAEAISAHDGIGQILFRRVFDERDSEAFDFLDYSVLPPHTSIGYHRHSGTEEIYVILKGRGIYCLNGMAKEVSVGDVVAATDGDQHGLENPGEEEMEILVVEAKVRNEQR